MTVIYFHVLHISVLIFDKTSKLRHFAIVYVILQQISMFNFTLLKYLYEIFILLFMLYVSNAGYLRLFNSNTVRCIELSSKILA